jgi:peroxiredoxin
MHSAFVIGISADSIERLDQFSADPNYCAGKFPVASDANGKVAALYHLTTTAAKSGMKDVRGVAIDHDFIERETFVISKDYKIVATFSSKEDHLAPNEHVKKALQIVQQLSAK